jgi:hypothetical protein
MALSIETKVLKNSLLSVITKGHFRKVLIPSFLSYRWSLRPWFYLFSIGYVMLAMHLPVSIYTWAVYDDALFWGNAGSILGGHWLGAYSQMTLAKGSGFPLFLAVNALIGTPITLSITLFYLFACGLIAHTLRALGVNKYVVLILFIIILFHPELFPTRIIRDNIYPALSLIILSGVIRLVFAPQPHDQQITSVIPYGLAFGLFWITREEGIWIIPSLLLLLLLKVWQLKNKKVAIKNIFYRFACFSLMAILFVSLIAAINYYKYGKFESVDFKGSAYSGAIKSLNSVDVGQDLPYLPVSFAKRQAIYKISPSFTQLKDFFEETGKSWTAPGCEIYPWTCGDYAGGWFAWALREAVANKGYYQTPVRVAEFYSNITKEIETACDTGLIKCKTNPIPFMPNISMAQLKQFPEKVLEALKLAMVQSPVPITAGFSGDPLNQLQTIRLFLGNPRSTLAASELKTELKGWFYSTNSDWIELTCIINKEKIKRVIDRISSPDIAAYFKNSNANFQRFSISVSGDEECSISTNNSSSNTLLIKLLQGKQGINLNIGDNSTLYIDKISKSLDYYEKYKPLKLKNLLGKLYKFLMPIIVLLGAFIYLIYLLCILARRASVTDIFIVSTMMWCLFISRIIIIILVDISSFPAVNELYMSAAFPILFLAAFLSLQLAFNAKIKYKSLPK